jgi:trehalose synthase
MPESLPGRALSVDRAEVWSRTVHEKLLQSVDINPRTVTDFGNVVSREDLENLEILAAGMREQLRDRVVWHVNTTASGGGVAEMLHTLLAYVRGLGLDTRWTVISGTPGFFRITKRLHNALHGERGDGSGLGEPERRIYEDVMRHNAGELCALVDPHDVVVLHDPQTAGLIPYLVRHGAAVIWRCHIGQDERSTESERGWSFLEPYLRDAHAFIFSRFAYVPDFCDHGRSVIVAPSIDPLSPKNQSMDSTTVRSILAHTGLIDDRGANGARSFLRSDGTSGHVERQADVLRFGPPPPADAPLVVQVSRWDRLKDPVGVLHGFARTFNGEDPSGGHLVLAGPNAKAVTDDPEGLEVFEEVEACWNGLPERIRSRVHLANLPMDDLQENAAIVNALQRHAAIVVQKSLREGFGLTVTEAMWKERAMVASAVGGIQDQIEHGVSGYLLRDPTDLDGYAAALRLLLGRPNLARRLGQNARRRVGLNYLGLRTLHQYADLIQRLLE